MKGAELMKMKKILAAVLSLLMLLALFPTVALAADGEGSGDTESNDGVVLSKTAALQDDGTYTINKEYLARVKEIVDYCEKAGVYSVINIHHFDEFIIRRNNLEDCEKIFTNLWTQIAEYFADYPYTVVFEGFNEYLGV